VRLGERGKGNPKKGAATPGGGDSGERGKQNKGEGCMDFRGGGGDSRGQRTKTNKGGKQNGLGGGTGNRSGGNREERPVVKQGLHVSPVSKGKWWAWGSVG